MVPVTLPDASKGLNLATSRKYWPIVGLARATTVRGMIDLGSNNKTGTPHATGLDSPYRCWWLSPWSTGYGRVLTGLVETAFRKLPVWAPPLGVLSRHTI